MSSRRFVSESFFRKLRFGNLSLQFSIENKVIFKSSRFISQFKLSKHHIFMFLTTAYYWVSLNNHQFFFSLFPVFVIDNFTVMRFCFAKHNYVFFSTIIKGLYNNNFIPKYMRDNLFFFRSLIGRYRASIFESVFVIKDRLSVTGYSRRAWINKSRSWIFFKVGQSFINKIKIPFSIRVRLVRKRMLFLVSSNWRTLCKFSHRIYNLRKADNYRAEGIQLKSQPLTLKNPKSVS